MRDEALLTRDGLFELERARRAAMVAADIEALDRLIAPDFVYQHGTGACQDKPEYLRLIAEGAYSYRAIESEHEWVFIRDSVAVMVATLRLCVVTAGAPFVATRRATMVWAHDGQDWRITAYQGCIPADEAQRAREALHEPDEVKRAMAAATER